METMEEEGGELAVGGVSALTLEWQAWRFVPIFKGSVSSQEGVGSRLIGSLSQPLNLDYGGFSVVTKRGGYINSIPSEFSGEALQGVLQQG